MALMLESSAFENSAEIPARYTCKGDDVSSPLRRKPGNRPLLFSSLSHKVIPVNRQLSVVN